MIHELAEDGHKVMPAEDQHAVHDDGPLPSQARVEVECRSGPTTPTPLRDTRPSQTRYPPDPEPAPPPAPKPGNPELVPAAVAATDVADTVPSLAFEPWTTTVSPT